MKYLQNSMEKICVGVSCNNVAGLELATLFKRDSNIGISLLILQKIFRTASWRLLPYSRAVCSFTKRNVHHVGFSESFLSKTRKSGRV